MTDNVHQLKAPKPTYPSITYKAHTVTVNASLYFEIKGPLVEGSYCESLQKAKDQIDKATSAQRAQKRVKLSLPILGSDGQPGILTGLHAGTGYFTGTNVEAGIYPDVPWIGYALKKLKAYEEEAKKLRQILHRYEIRRDYRGRIEAEYYDSRIENLKAGHASKLKEAQAEQAKQAAAVAGGIQDA